MRSHVVVALLAMAVLGGCAGSGSQGRATVYFLVDGGSAALGSSRSLSGGPQAAEALSLLLAGPTAGERAAGVTSAFPSTSRLSSLAVGDRSGEALVELSGVRPPPTAVGRVRMITQVARTLIGVQGIERVRIRLDGEPLGLWTQSGTVLDKAYGYDDLLGFYGICVGQSAGVPVGDCFSALP